MARYAAVFCRDLSVKETLADEQSWQNQRIKLDASLEVVGYFLDRIIHTA